MRKKIFLFGIFLVILGVSSFSLAKEELKDPQNTLSNHNELTVNRQYTMLNKFTEDFNGMDYEAYKLECRGEDYLEKDGIIKYAQKGNGEFVIQVSILKLNIKE